MEVRLPPRAMRVAISRLTGTGPGGEQAGDIDAADQERCSK